MMKAEELTLTQEWDKAFPRDDVDPDRIGICGFGGMAINAAALDQRIKATVAMTMYDMSRVTREGYFGSTDGWNTTGTISFMNQPLLDMAGEVDTPVLLVQGEKAHSRYFSEGAYEHLRGDNKELVIVPGPNHVDLYDNRKAIPFDGLEAFFGKNLR